MIQIFNIKKVPLKFLNLTKIRKMMICLTIKNNITRFYSLMGD